MVDRFRLATVPYKYADEDIFQRRMNNNINFC